MTTPARIFIAEEDPETRCSFQAALVRAGYRVPLLASDGPQALVRARDAAADLALVSVTLPGAPTGLETARLLQEEADLPVILLAPPGRDLSWNRSGAPLHMGSLTRPVSEDELVAAVGKALRQTAARARNALERRTMAQTLTSLQDGVITTDLSGCITFLNPRAAALLGCSAEAALGQPLDLITAEAPIAAGTTSSPLENADGSLWGHVHVLRTPARTEPDSPTSLTDLAHGIPDPLIALDPALIVTHLNEPAASFLGASREQAVGKPFWSHLPPSAAERHAIDVEKVLREKVAHAFHLRQEEKDSWWNAQLYPVGDQLLLLLQDITEQRRAAAEAERLSRLEGLGHLARGFAHDFNNLLTVLMGNLSLARTQAGSGEVQRQLEEAESATLRARDLVEQLTTFAKGGAPIKGVLPLRPLLTDLLSQRPASSRISYDTHFEGTEFTLEADPKQLRRLLENLIRNAEQAIPGQGEIHIRCSREEDRENGEDWLRIEIRDTGSGMSRETLAQAFDPFFTTRVQGNASGLGLTVCDSIARAHGGSVSLESSPGEGTTALVRLPAQARANRPGDPSQPPTRLNGHAHEKRLHSAPARILVLEDESLIRRLIHSTLTHAGFQVDETSHGQETVDAFRQAREGGHPYDLLIMDLTIENGMGGVEAMRRIRELDPGALAIVSSGYSDDPAMARPSDYGFSFVLPKPYQPDHLVEAVERMLTERPPSGS